MERTIKIELSVLFIAVAIFTAFLYPALLHARREARDGIRRDEVAAVKHLLEQYYNEHEHYPLTFDASPHQYIVTSSTTNGATAWYVRAELENKHETSAGYDGDEERQYHWRLVNEGDRTYYEVCGGTPTCAVADPR